MRVGAFVLAAQFPGQGAGEALHRAVRTAEVSEEAGLDSVWLAEHHFVPYGVCPSAVTLAALLLGRTRRLRVGTAVTVLPSTHPVALGEQTALLHLTSGGRFTLGVGRGGPWVDLEVFGGGLEAYGRLPGRSGPAAALAVRVAGGGRRRAARLPRGGRRTAALGLPGRGRAAARGDRGLHLAGVGADGRAAGLPMLLGMHCGDEDKAAMVALWRRTAREAGYGAPYVAAAGHVSAGVCQLADRTADARETLVKNMPGWFRQGLDAHVTVDGRKRAMRDPVAYTELLCALHPVGTPALAADRLAATAERTGITRFALLAEGSGDLAATEENVRRLGAEVLPRLG